MTNNFSMNSEVFLPIPFTLVENILTDSVCNIQTVVTFQANHRLVSKLP